jgi:hypothetical protein
MCHPRGKEERLRAPLLRLLGIGLGFALLAGSSGHAEVIHLVPEDRASWRARNLFGFVRPGHFYGERKIEIETTPAGATLDLFYVRSNFQKLYEQTEAPATVMLPKRSEAGPRDAVTIRAFLPGYRQKEVSVRVESGQESVLLELDPLPNMLRGLTHTYFGGRASLAFLTDETPQVRVQERAGGFNVILGETGATPEVLAGVDGLHSPVLETVETLQLGEDLLVRIGTCWCVSSWQMVRLPARWTCALALHTIRSGTCIATRWTWCPRTVESPLWIGPRPRSPRSRAGTSRVVPCASTSPCAAHSIPPRSPGRWRRAARSRTPISGRP